MKRIVTLLSIYIYSTSSTRAQQGKITGSVGDVSSKGIHSATVSLLRAKDSSLVKFAATNKLGEYEFQNIQKGKYYVSASNVGYGTIAGAAFEIASVNSSRFYFEPAGKGPGCRSGNGKKTIY